MRRLCVCTTAVLVFLAWSTLAVVNGDRIRQPERGAKVEKPRPGERARVTIVFRGLQVFHPDPARQYLEAGILRAPEHKFQIEVREKSSAGVSSFTVPSESLRGAENDVWSFEFTSSANRGVSFYQNGAFDRKAGIGDERDFRWAVDVEGKEFYNQQLSTKQNQLGPILRITSGEFYTRTRTRPLLRSKGNGPFEYFGSAADEIAADLFVDAGDVVLRSANSGKEILRLKDKPGTSYEIVVENEFITEAHGRSTGHSEYYYRFITKPRDEWYDFKVARQTSSANSHFNHYAGPEAACFPWWIFKRKNSLK
jgi:hypothetical protein